MRRAPQRRFGGAVVMTGVVRAPGWAVLGQAVLVVALFAAAAAFGPPRPAHAHTQGPDPGDVAGGHVVSGGGFVNSSSYEAGSYAFAVRRDGVAYLVTAQHVAPEGAVVYGPGGLVGATSIVSSTRDTSYVRLDSGEPTGRVRIALSASGEPVTATVDSVARRGSITAGQRVCHSGYSASTQAAGGFVCGEILDVPAACGSYRPDLACQITMRGEGGQRVGWLGDSGGPVWQQVAPGRVRLLGVFTSVSAPDGGSPTLGHFVPAFDVLDDLGGVPVSAAS